MAKGLEVGIGNELAKILEEYGNEVQETAKKEIRAVAIEAAEKLQGSSPRRSGVYASGWKAKKNPDGSAVVYNAKKPQITYLLEYGHLSANEYNTYGRVPAKPHIKPVEEWANEELVRRIESDIERGLT